MAFEILSPLGAPDPTVHIPLSPRPRTLAGKRLGLLDNGKHNARPVLMHLAAELARQSPLAEVVVRTKPSASTGASPELVEELKMVCDLVIAGVGD